MTPITALGSRYGISGALGRSVKRRETFLPTDIAGLIAWFKSDTAVYQDAGGTVPAVVTTDPVKLWKDQSGNGYDVTAATDGVRPTVVTGMLNGYPLLRFTQAAQSRMSNATGISQPFTLCMFVESKLPNYSEVFGDLGASLLRGKAVWGLEAGAYKWSTLATMATQAVFGVMNGASSKVRANKVDSATLSPGTAAMTDLNIGTAGNYGNMDGYEFIAYNSVLSDADIVRVEDYFYKKYGTNYILTIGDSKTTLNYPNYWQDYLRLSWEIETKKPLHVDKIATAGWKISDIKGAIDAGLAALTTTPSYIFINEGVNETALTAIESSYKSDYQYVLDAIHTKFPTAQIRMSNVWKRNWDVTVNANVNQWIDDLVALNSSFCTAGDDERVWLENGDDGATYTTDGVHYNAAGATEKAAQLVTILGI